MCYPPSGYIILSLWKWKVYGGPEAEDRIWGPGAGDWINQRPNKDLYSFVTWAWSSSVRLIYSRPLYIILLWLHRCELSFFIALKIISQISVWSSVGIKGKRYAFNRMRLIYLKGKQTKKLFVTKFFLSGSYWRIYENERKWGKHIQDGEGLAERLLNEKGNKGYKDEDWEKNVWRTVGQFLLVLYEE